MKNKIIILSTSLLVCANIIAAIPAGYYDSAAGLAGATLRQALHDIIDNHTVLSYDDVWTAYQTTDVDSNGYIWDMYTDIPWTYLTDQQGYDGDMDVYTNYNREHSWPKSWANETSPHYTDLNHLYPVQAYANSYRNNNPYGEVGASVTYTSENGSKLGAARTGLGYTGTVFEPIDKYKGDLARTYFYISTRYYGEDAAWDSVEMAVGCELQTWALNMLLSWNTLDPVSQKEIDRNDAVYALQGNRNPFIDHPEYVDSIWTTNDTTQYNTTTSNGNIFFSEYIEGSSYNKALELYNNSGANIDMSYVTIKLYSNGATSASSTLSLSGSLNDNNVYVLCHTSANEAIQAQADMLSGSINFNGNDAVELYYSDSLVDVLGVVGSAAYYADDVTLVRKASVLEGNTSFTASEWDSYSIDETSYLGSHTISDSQVPITLSKFNADVINGGVKLSWETQSETNNAFFLIFRNNENIAVVDGAGTTTKPNYYTYLDDQIVPGISYTYVLADMDYANKVSRYEDKAITVSIEGQDIDATFKLGNAYPNPFNPVINLPLNIYRNGDVDIEIYDLHGNLVRDVLHEDMAIGAYDIPINGKDMASGIYFLHVRMNGCQSSQKILLLK